MQKTAPTVEKFIKTVGKTTSEVESWFDKVKPESKVGLSLHIGFEQEKAFATMGIGMNKECLIVQRDLFEYGRSEFPVVLKKILGKEGIKFFAYDVDKVFKRCLYYALSKDVEVEKMIVKGVKGVKVLKQKQVRKKKGKLTKGKLKKVKLEEGRFELKNDLEEMLKNRNDVDERVSDYVRDIVEFCCRIAEEEEEEEEEELE